MKLSERIAAAMAHAKITPSMLVKKTGSTKGAVSQWLSGTTKNLKSETALSISVATGVRHAWLIAGDGEMLEVLHHKSLGRIGLEVTENYRETSLNLPSVPLISYARAGRWGEINGYVPDTDRRTEARYTAPSSSAFALVVVGESMTSSDAISFPQGTVLVVDPERSPKSGDFVIAKDTAVNAGAFRKLMRDGARWYLKPLNRDYPILELEDMAKRVVGVVIEFQPPGGKL